MKTTIMTVACWAKNQHGVNAGAPQYSSSDENNAASAMTALQQPEWPAEWNGASVPPGWPTALSDDDEYKRTLAESVAWVTSQRERGPYDHALASREWDPHLLARIIAVMIMVGVILFAGCRMASTIPSVVRGAVAAMTNAASE